MQQLMRARRIREHEKKREMREKGEEIGEIYFVKQKNKIERR